MSDRLAVIGHDRDTLIGRIAAELDKPSVYMGGPSKRSLRLAEAVVTITDDHYRGAVEALREIARLEHVNAADSIVNAAGRDAREALERLGGQS